MEILLIILYAIPLLFVFTYSLIQLNLVYLYLKNKKENCQSNRISDTVYEPVVTIQLPLYNEKYVVERLIDCITKIDYPKEKLEIQVLDDSTDESFDIAAKKVIEYKEKGFDIQHIKRSERNGFKAGALAYGLNICRGEYVAIFDADFMPFDTFLKDTIPHFVNDKIGVVQTKWEHLNLNYSLLTKLQAFGLDAHFSIEQVGRNQGNHFINFNGTAGVWRKKCIEDAGGWSSDTLTEDLDLSYRAQLKGWEFKYLENVQSPSELPVAMNALKNQQFRWTKGAAECVKKNLFKVLKDGKLSFGTKFHALFHLMNSTIFICIVIMSLLSVPLLIIKENYPDYRLLFNLASLFMSSLLILIVFYWVSYKENEKKGGFWSFLLRFPIFLSVSMGLSLHNAIAVIEGYIGKKSPFLRTPKFNVKENTGNAAWSSNEYLKSSITWMSLLELFFAIYFLSGIYLAFRYHDFGLFPFHIMLFGGYLYVFWKSTFHSIISSKK